MRPLLLVLDLISVTQPTDPSPKGEEISDPLSGTPKSFSITTDKSVGLKGAEFSRCHEWWGNWLVAVLAASVVGVGLWRARRVAAESRS
jgi:hypothetical protein